MAARVHDLLHGAPWVLAPAAVLVGWALAALGDIAASAESRSTAFGSHPGISLLQTTVNGLNFRDRILQVLNFGSPLWALGLLIGLAVLVFGEGREPLDARQSKTHSLVLDGYAGAAALTVLAAVIDAIVWITYFPGSPAVGVRSFLLDVGAAVVAVAVLWWALDRRARYHGLPSLLSFAATSSVANGAGRGEPVAGAVPAGVAGREGPAPTSPGETPFVPLPGSAEPGRPGGVVPSPSGGPSPWAPAPAPGQTGQGGSADQVPPSKADRDPFAPPLERPAVVPPRPPMGDPFAPPRPATEELPTAPPGPSPTGPFAPGPPAAVPPPAAGPPAAVPPAAEPTVVFPESGEDDTTAFEVPPDIPPER